MVRGDPPALSGPLDLVIVDDDLGGPYPPGPSDYVGRALGSELASRYTGGSRILLVFAEPRAWKGRAGFGEPAREALASYASDAELIVLFGHPRLGGGAAQRPRRSCSPGTGSGSCRKRSRAGFGGG